MRSYSAQTTIALLCAVTPGAAAVSSRRRNSQSARVQRQLLDISDPFSQDGLINKLLGEKNVRSGSIVPDTKPDVLGTLVDKAAVQRSKMRGGTIHQGSGALQGQVGGKGIGKGYHYGKDCKKGSKGKGKGKGKGDGKGTKGSKGYFGKGKGKGTSGPSSAPTSAPSISNAPSYSPSESPTNSPTEEWCHEDFWPSQHDPNHQLPDPTPQPTNAVPTVSPAPSTSMAPSSDPTVSPAPTVTPAPSTSEAPSDPPSISVAPNFVAPTGISPGQQAKSFCQLANTEYVENGAKINFWLSGNPKPDEWEKKGTAAFNSAFSSPIITSDTQQFSASVSFKVNNDETSKEVIQGVLDNGMTPPMVYEIIGCRTEARASAEQYYDGNNQGRRKLQSGEFVAMRNWNCGDKTCIGEQCDIDCSTGLNYIGDLDFEGFKDVLYWSLKEYFSMLDDVTSWYPRQTLNETNIAIDQDQFSIDGINEAETRQSASGGMRAGPFIGAATGLLALLLLMVLFVRRRKYGQEDVSHLKLEDELEDDTFYNGSDGDSVERNAYNTRDTHIVGEGDSVISHWTGYTGRKPPSNEGYEMSYNRSGLMKGSPADVHQCSSATCDLCHENRQAGVQFVKTGAVPERTHSLPSENSRDYIQEDTVLL